jgi:hypothetical protein
MVQRAQSRVDGSRFDGATISPRVPKGVDCSTATAQRDGEAMVPDFVERVTVRATPHQFVMPSQAAS